MLALRQRDFDAASQRLEHARGLASNNGHVYRLLGFLESNRGRSPEAIADFRKAVEINSHDLRARYALAQEVERQGGKEGEAEFEQAIEKILDADPDNVAALLELCRIAAKRGEASVLNAAVAKIAVHAKGWPPEVQEQVAALQTAAHGEDLRRAATQSTLLRNVLWRVPVFRRGYARMKAPAGEELEPFTAFLRMEPPVFKPAHADAAIAFDPQSPAGLSSGQWS